MNPPAGPGWIDRLRGPVEATWPATIHVERDLPYGRRPAQRLDLYRPQDGQRLPVLVLVHGGAWSTGDKANPGFITNKVLHWVARGWVVISLNYRLLPWAQPIDQAADVARAIAVVQARVGDWGGDGARVCLLGHSTGAHLSALVLADRTLGEPFGMTPVRGSVLVDSAALDVVRLMESHPLPLHERAFGHDPREWPTASPWHRLTAAPPPLLLACSALRAQGVEQNESFAARVRELGGTAQVLVLPLGHAELNVQLGTPGELTESVDAFLDEVCPRDGADWPAR